MRAGSTSSASSRRRFREAAAAVTALGAIASKTLVGERGRRGRLRQRVRTSRRLGKERTKRSEESASPRFAPRRPLSRLCERPGPVRAPQMRGRALCWPLAGLAVVAAFELHRDQPLRTPSLPLGLLDALIARETAGLGENSIALGADSTAGLDRSAPAQGAAQVPLLSRKKPHRPSYPAQTLQVPVDHFDESSNETFALHYCPCERG